MGLGKQIKLYRERAGWTQEQLSERSDVDVGTISALEVRDSQRSRFIGKLAAAFGLSIDQLADESRAYPVSKALGHTAQESVAAYKVSPERWPFLLSRSRYELLSERDKGRIDGFMIALAEASEGAPKKVSNGS